VVVASPTGEHVAHVLASLDAGLHVLADKPLATTADDAELLAHAGADIVVHTLDEVDLEALAGGRLALAQA